MASTVVWFDIPVSDMDRAIKFYEALTDQRLTRLPVGRGEETALFEPGEKGEVRPIADDRGVFAYVIDSEGNRVGLHAMA